jgi:hypothetical protein
MVAAATHRGPSDDSSTRMSKGMVCSLIFHGLVLAFAIFGFPYLSRPEPVIEQPIPVEVMTVADKNQINKPAATPIKQNIRQQDTKPLVKPAPPTSKAEAPPKIVPPEKPEPLKSEAKPTPAEDALAPPQKVLKKIEPKKLTPPKPIKPPDEKPKVEPQQDFQSAVLKNLINSDTSKANDTAPVNDKAAPTPDAAQADQATMDQMAAATQQLGECWKLLAGARYAEDLVVKIHITMNPDKTVASANVVDQARYNTDTFFRAAADSAQRAVYDPHCNPLTALPDGKYDLWKDMNVNFDPREMLQ